MSVVSLTPQKGGTVLLKVEPFSRSREKGFLTFTGPKGGRKDGTSDTNET
ncbi:hypothetical protein LSP04_23280 [Levilactobacillus spicheri]|uniref:Uncharacterized protein n=1 Tax=Levilactobacillus spicheri TaxID=216463 RepID=A0ABQ0WSP5_9LACO|nr:hypothetical protein LSP04_23280 [Levilactobacillus spicheri]